MKSSLAKHVASGVTDEQKAANQRAFEGELHRLGVGIVRYEDATMPWELRHRVETEQAKKFGARRR